MRATLVLLAACGQMYQQPSGNQPLPESRPVEGPPAEAILRAAEADKPDLIVMGSRGSGGLPGALIGSVAEQVVRHATTPVLVVK